MILIVYIVL